jgi:hypothetical protein
MLAPLLPKVLLLACTWLIHRPVVRDSGMRKLYLPVESAGDRLFSDKANTFSVFNIAKERHNDKKYSGSLFRKTIEICF